MTYYPPARGEALEQILDALAQVEAHVAAQPQSPAQVAAQASVSVAQQDVEARPDGTVELRQGVAPERRFSVEDPDMRRGRRNRTQRVDGDKRHVLRELVSTLVWAVGVTLTNAPRPT